MELEGSRVFQYDALGSREIRLLQFNLRECTDRKLSCTLQTIALYDEDSSSRYNNKYIALSYTWSPNHPSHQIILNKQNFTVGKNLYTALQILLQVADGRLRPEARALQPDTSRSEGPLLFWIDAICIDQNNVAERGHQVNMMADIYTNAAFVIAWLGPSQNNSALAVKSIRNSDSKPQEARDALGSLAACKYWNRMWVAQEFVLASTLFVLCGQDGFWWDEIPDMERGFAAFSQEILMLWDKRRKRRQAQKTTGYSLPLYDLIEGLSSRGCSNKLDKVYALLGLVYPPSQEIQKLHVDYNITPDKLYYTVMSHLTKIGSLRRSIHKWRRFRMKLRKSLDLPLDKNHENHELIYDITAERRLFAKDTGRTDWTESTPEHIVRTFTQALYENFGSDLGGQPRYGIGTVDSWESQFASFPQNEDPHTWRHFQVMLRNAADLGLSSGDTVQTASLN